MIATGLTFAGAWFSALLPTGFFRWRGFIMDRQTRKWIERKDANAT